MARLVFVIFSKRVLAQGVLRAPVDVRPGRTKRWAVIVFTQTDVLFGEVMGGWSNSDRRLDSSTRLAHCNVDCS